MSVLDCPSTLQNARATATKVTSNPTMKVTGVLTDNGLTSIATTPLKAM